jgi:PAS domain S-box-containing protein
MTYVAAYIEMAFSGLQRWLQKKDLNRLAKPGANKKSVQTPPRRNGVGAPDPGHSLNALARLGERLNLAGSIDEAADAALDHLVQTVGCDLAMLHLMSGGVLHLHEIRRAPDCAGLPGDEALELGQALGGEAAQSGRPVYFSPADSGLKSAAGLPLLSKSKVVGALTLGWRSPRDLNPMIPGLEAACALLSASLRRIQLSEELDLRLAELAKSEERFRTAFMISPDVVSLTRLSDMTMVEVNQAFLGMTGLRRDEVLGRTTLDLDLWADVREREGLMQALIAEGQAQNLTAQFKLKDGRRAIGIVSAKLIQLEGESYVLSFTRDITAQVEAQRALEQSEENFRQMAENIGEVFWLRTVDMPPKYIYVSPAFEEVWGIPREVLYRDAEELFHSVVPEDRDGLVQAMQSNQPTAEGQHHEFRIKRPDGSLRWIWARRAPIADNSGKVYRVAGLAQDVTERRLAEMALKESEANLAAAINSVDEIMLMLDESLTIVWANDAARRIYGRDLEGAKCYEICMDSEGPCQRCLAAQTLADGGPHELETQTRAADGAKLELWGRSAVASRHPDGRPKSVVVVFMDMTQKRALEAETMRAGRLASIGELAAGVAHEINNPINGIIACAELLTQEGRQPLSSSELADRIISEGERVATIIRSLLSFAREGGEAMGPVDLGLVLDDCLALMEAQLNKDGIELAVQVEDDLPLVWGNAHQIQQVALNLMSNARYALNQKHRGAHPGKQLLIRARSKTLAGKKMVRLVFRDLGVGLEPGLDDKIFDPFFSTKPPGQGTGLGLSISHGIVSAHGGKLRLESRQGEYTEAVVELPAHERSEA